MKKKLEQLKNRESILVIIATCLLLMISISLASVNYFLREENRVLLNSFIQVTNKVQELENEMQVKRFPPVSPEKAAEFTLQAKKLNLAPTRYNLENKGFIIKDGKSTGSCK
ncbi:MAG: hypothetical protein PHT31_05785 [Candidatus Omnitrophica bacterium]|nr:hypothetical protein [Candidatus Omnitrophota bacterium]MDD5653648.1 hypothetical protein [Candidatus Omnitrophota bacterium]